MGNLHPSLTAVLFAGGHSTRMGADKATLHIAGGPLWARQIETLRQLKPQALRVSARERPAWCPPDIHVVLDEPPSRGPLSGLVATLRRLETTHLLALAIDLPRMTTDELLSIWKLARPGRGVIPMNGKYFEPLCAIYPAEAGDTVADALDCGNLSLQRVAAILESLDRVQAYRLSEEERPLFLNLNAPRDLGAFA